MGTLFKTIDQEVSFFYPKTRLLIIAIALLLAVLPLPELFLQLVSLVLILSIGLMHGATDHFLYMNANGLNTSQPIPLTFFIKYLFTLLLMALTWWISPLLALGIFILTSAYHFGQTQWQYIALSETSFLKKAIYSSWGILVLGLIVLLNPVESDALISSVIDGQFSISQINWLVYALPLLFLFLLILGIKHMRKRTFIFELVEIGVITLLALKGDLLLSFGVFFGLWHSLRASQVQIDKLKEDQSFNWKHFIKGSIPFTLISLMGIALLLWASIQLNQRIKPEMLFLIAISVLTMPHMVIYEDFYRVHDHKRTD